MRTVNVLAHVASGKRSVGALGLVGLAEVSAA